MLAEIGGGPVDLLKVDVQRAEMDVLAGIDDEDIQVLEIGLEELFEQLARGLIEDTKLAIGAYWLQNRTSPQA